MAASDRAITEFSPAPPANHIIWRMSQPEPEGLPGGEAGPARPGGAAAAGGLAGVAGGLADKEGPRSGGSDSSG